MSILIRDQGRRSELQERIGAELREKIAQQAGEGEGAKDLIEELPDGVEDSVYVKNYQKSKPIPRLVIILIISGVVLLLFGLVLVIAN